MLESRLQVKRALTDGAVSSQLSAITGDTPQEKDPPWGLLETPLCSYWVQEPWPSQLPLGGTQLGRAVQGTGLGPGSTFRDQEAEAGARERLGQGWDWGGLTFEDQGAEARQAPRQLGQGGLQQLRVLVATQLQEVHLQQLRGLLGIQAQQPAAAPGVQVQA